MNGYSQGAPAPMRECGDDLPASAARVRQAARGNNSPDDLRRLASDGEILVRAAVAINAECGPEIDVILAQDEDERVRALLGCRIARLLPKLSGIEQSGMTDHVLRTLTGLARDQAIRVRATIADEIKTMSAAPRELVLLLASDAVVEVSSPILRLSPVLTDTDLLKLIATPPSSQTVGSIASRTHLSAPVADSIVAYADAPAIRTLLANQSANIQEATLDALVGRASHYLDWHVHLVRRPHLSTNAVRALSSFIASDLLQILAGRVDLDFDKLEAVRQRLACETAVGDDEPIILDAERLKRRGQLTEEMLLEAAEHGHSRRVAILLAVASGVSVQAVDRAVELRSTKALVSLAWRAGFTMRAGTAAQLSLAQFSPDHILLPTVNGSFPLSREEMEWQMELMDSVETRPPLPTPA